jgi:hypothetical protein
MSQEAVPGDDWFRGKAGVSTDAYLAIASDDKQDYRPTLQWLSDSRRPLAVWRHRSQRRRWPVESATG